MRRGRPPKPSNLRVIEGNRGHRKIAAEVVPIRRGMPIAPSWLTEYAREEFARVVGELHALGLVVELDLMTICAHCEFVSTFRTATETLSKLAVGDAGAGLVAKMASGSIVTHPVLAVKNRAQRDVLRASLLLGLSPSGRVGLEGKVVPDEADVSILKKYFRRDHD